MRRARAGVVTSRNKAKGIRGREETVHIGHRSDRAVVLCVTEPPNKNSGVPVLRVAIIIVPRFRVIL